MRVQALRGIELSSHGSLSDLPLSSLRVDRSSRPRKTRPPDGRVLLATLRGPPTIGWRSTDPVSCCRTTERLTAAPLPPKRRVRAAARRGRPAATTRTRRSRRWVEEARRSVCSAFSVPCLAYLPASCSKRGRRHMHAPDGEYDAKLARVATITWYSRQTPAQLVQLYQDELTDYRRATVSDDYVRASHDGPHAEQGWGATTSRRIAGCLDAATGALFAWQRAHFDHQTLLRFDQAVEAASPEAKQIFLINADAHPHSAPLRSLHKTLTYTRHETACGRVE